MKRHQVAIKSSVDYVAASVGLLVLSPLMFLIALAIKLESRGPAVLKQQRLGKDGRLFGLYKFRTMYSDSPLKLNPDGSTFVSDRDPRVTRVGRLLRGGLDELPQLLNILKGQMSVVGPRPDLPAHLERYTATERKKLSVKPGITNLPAVSGRNGIPWRSRIAIDIRYIEDYSLWLDLKIIALTLALALRRPKTTVSLPSGARAPR